MLILQLYASTTVVLNAELTKGLITLFMILQTNGFRFKKFSHVSWKNVFSVPSAQWFPVPSRALHRPTLGASKNFGAIYRLCSTEQPGLCSTFKPWRRRLSGFSKILTVKFLIGDDATESGNDRSFHDCNSWSSFFLSSMASNLPTFCRRRCCPGTLRFQFVDIILG